MLYNSVQNLEYLGPHFIQVGVCIKPLKQMVSSIETSSGSSNWFSSNSFCLLSNNTLRKRAIPEPAEKISILSRGDNLYLCKKKLYRLAEDMKCNRIQYRLVKGNFQSPNLLSHNFATGILHAFLQSTMDHQKAMFASLSTVATMHLAWTLNNQVLYDILESQPTYRSFHSK